MIAKDILKVCSVMRDKNYNVQAPLKSGEGSLMSSTGFRNYSAIQTPNLYF